MRKKAYIEPNIQMVTLRQQLMNNFTGGGEDVNVDPEPDESDDDNRAKSGWESGWNE